MVRAWFRDDDDDSEKFDQRVEHQLNPSQMLDLQMLYKNTGVEYFKMNLDTYETDGVLEKIREERGYKYEDNKTVSKECLPDYEYHLKRFFNEHMHADDEIRFVLAGSGYFDVRNGSDGRWIRIEIGAGDMIIIPSGIYHRFSLDVDNYIKAKLYYMDGPDSFHYRKPEADDMECRKNYVAKLKILMGI